MEQNNNQQPYAEPTVQQAPVQQPVYETQPAPQSADNSMKTMIFGIIGLVLAESGIAGLIFSILSLKEAKKYQANFGQLTGKAKVGKILGNIGLIVSIIMIAFWAIYILVVIIAAIAAAASSSYYYY
ncbi:MAG: hypothetical protein ACI4GZ_06890 [Ruminococcus sp.]